MSLPAEAAEPQVGRASVPVWLLILLFLLLYWGMVYFDRYGGWFSPVVYTPYKSVAELAPYQPRQEGCNLVRGRAVFELVCGLCHGNDGLGRPALAPPLAASEWVMGSPARLIRIPLLGLNGPIVVGGKQLVFPAGMGPMGAAFSDEDLANVLCYIRRSWGNKAPDITPDQIRAVRAEIGNRSQPFTPEELQKLP